MQEILNENGSRRLRHAVLGKCGRSSFPIVYGVQVLIERLVEDPVWEIVVGGTRFIKTQQYRASSEEIQNIWNRLPK